MIVLTFAQHIRALQRKHIVEFGDSLNCYITPPRGQTLYLYSSQDSHVISMLFVVVEPVGGGIRVSACRYCYVNTCFLSCFLLVDQTQ